MSSGVLWDWGAMRTVPHHCKIYLLVGYLCIGWGAGLTGSVSTLGSEYYFSSNGIWCGGGVGTGLDLRLVWGVGCVGMLTACGSTLGGGWVLF